jgi:hypothetical protein
MTANFDKPVVFISAHVPPHSAFRDFMTGINFYNSMYYTVRMDVSKYPEKTKEQENIESAINFLKTKGYKVKKEII